MKLVSLSARSVVDLPETSLPPYAILCHTQHKIGQESPNTNRARRHNSETPPRSSAEGPPSYTEASAAISCETLDRASDYARQSGVEYIWIDELCINRNSTADLEDAVNGSRRRLCSAMVCLVYLHDLPAETTLECDSVWRRCRYWTRAWTLQELTLPPRVRFYDCEWNYRGDKDSPELAHLVSEITSIPRSVLLYTTPLSDVALAVRIAWSIGRLAEREEDTVYALVAITGATLPVRYGEGAERAFLRLQEALLRDTCDGSLLAWRSAKEGEVRGLLARSPAEFAHFAQVSTEDLRPWVFDGTVRPNSKGIELESRVCQGQGSVLLSIGQRRQDLGKQDHFAICFRQWNGVYVRVTPALQVSSSALGIWRRINVIRDVDRSHSLSLDSHSDSVPCRLEIVSRGSHCEPPRRGLLPRVTQDAEVAMQGHDDQGRDAKLGGGKPLLALEATNNRTPSNHSDGSFVHVASEMGSGTDAQGLIPQQTPHSSDYDAVCLDEDVWESDNCSSTSLSTSDYESEYEGYNQGVKVHLRVPVAIGRDEEEAAANETRGIATLAANGEDHSRVENRIMQSSILDQVVGIAYERVCAWIPTVRYIAPPQDCFLPLSRINSTAWFAQPESLARLSISGADTKNQTISVFRPDGYFHLACPFFVADPDRHLSCLLRGRDIQGIADVLRHIRDHHPWRAYCARCHRDFDRYVERDIHMAERSCEVLPYSAPQGDASRKGVSEEEIHRLKRLDLRARRDGEVARWRRIYYALFPDLWGGGDDDQMEDRDEEYAKNVASAAGDDSCAEDDVEPYLRDGYGFFVSLVHDFWTQHKRECVAAVPSAYGRNPEELIDEDALAALYEGTLNTLISKVYHEYHPGANTS